MDCRQGCLRSQEYFQSSMQARMPALPGVFSEQHAGKDACAPRSIFRAACRQGCLRSQVCVLRLRLPRSLYYHSWNSHFGAIFIAAATSRTQS